MHQKAKINLLSTIAKKSTTKKKREFTKTISYRKNGQKTNGSFSLRSCKHQKMWSKQKCRNANGRNINGLLCAQIYYYKSKSSTWKRELLKSYQKSSF